MSTDWEFDVYRADEKLLTSDGRDKKLIALKPMKISERCIEHDSEAKQELDRTQGKFHKGGHLFCAIVNVGDTTGNHSHDHAFMVLRVEHPDPSSGHKYFYIGRVFEPKSKTSVDQLLEAGWGASLSHNGLFHSTI